MMLTMFGWNVQFNIYLPYAFFVRRVLSSHIIHISLYYIIFVIIISSAYVQQLQLIERRERHMALRKTACFDFLKIKF